MARVFAAGVECLEVDSAPVTAPPFTFAAWARSTNTAANQTLLWMGDKDVGNHFHRIDFRGDEAEQVNSWVNDGAVVDQLVGSAYTVNTWIHIGLVVSATNSRALYTNGGNKVTDSTTINPVNWDRVTLGNNGSTAGKVIDFLGDIAEVAFWNVALTDAELAMLGKGVSPLMVRPDALVAYWPLIGSYSPEIDLIAGRNLTVTGAVASPHPRIFYLPRPIVIISSAGGLITINPSSVVIPIVIPAPSISAIQTISPTPIAIPIVVPIPSVNIIRISPSPVAIPIVIPAPVVASIAQFQSFADIQRQLNPDDFGGTTFYLEVHGKTSSGANPMIAWLYNVTDSLYISGSSVSTSSTSKVRIRGTGFSLVSGDKIYEVRYGGDPGATYTLYDAVLLVEVG